MTADYAFEFEIKRSHRRKTLCLQIREGQVQVMVP
ncbi:MAG: M48 family peptidase, partial [Rhodospirillaceae bacterium]|nr:M48 family peptidase [Rhodospirillaceae bacterium]